MEQHSRPTEINPHQQSGVLELTFDDGARFRLPASLEPAPWSRRASQGLRASSSTRTPNLLELTRYVVLNPVRAGLVSAPGDWPWSSDRAMIGTSPVPNWLAVDGLLSQFGEVREEACGRAVPTVCARRCGRDLTLDPLPKWPLGAAMRKLVHLCFGALKAAIRVGFIPEIA